MSGAVTISATYGSAGGLIGPRVAQRLGLQFYDRAIPVAVAHELAVPLEEAVSRDEHAPRRFERLLLALANMSVPIGPDAPREYIDDPERFKEGTERVLREVAEGAGGVILGRGGSVVLRGRANVLCVRLDGPLKARLAQAQSRQGIDEGEARAAERESDGAHVAYMKAFYGVDPHDASLYHLILDSTAIPLDTCVDVIVVAARALLSASSLD